jgi:arylsulfatase A-like enzyme
MKKPYEGFKGTLGRTFASAEPWWPERPRARKGSPNVIIMIVDDMGYADLGCFGSEIATPNLDGLAADGLRYTDFNTSCLCSPTRAELLTGCHAHSVGMGFVANASPGFPGYTAELPRSQPTMAEAFLAAGYGTMAIGKWHLCRDADYHEAADKHAWPLQRGFEQYYGFLEALTSFHHPHRLYRGNDAIDVDAYPEGYYLTDDLTDQAMRMLRAHKAADPAKPFFMYFAHGAVHAPLHAKPVDMEKYRGRYAVGWDAVRQKRYERQKTLGIIAADTGLAPRNTETMEDVRAWDELTATEQSLFARYMETYAAMVDNLDQNVGRLRQCLRDLGEEDNTLFMYFSDNGGSREGMDRGTTSYFGGWNPTRSHKVADDLVAADHARLDEIGGPTTWPHYPRGWAMASNTPFRLYKMTAHAGGHRVPCIMSWPKGITARGELRRQYVHVTDVLPTLAEIVGFTVPDSRNGEPAVPRIGASFAASLADPAAPALHHETLIEVIGHRSFYRDGWEICTFHPARAPYRDEEWQLYHVAKDPTQLNDLAKAMPEKVRELAAAWEEAAHRFQVLPLYDGLGINRLQRPAEYESFARPVTLHPGTPTLERFRSAELIQDKSFRIRVRLGEGGLGAGDEGVLVAHGGQESGYLLYVEGGRIVFTQNVDSRMNTLEAAALPGTREIVVDITAPGARLWKVALQADGKPVAAGDNFWQFVGFLPYEGIDIGIDRRSPVSWELFRRRGPFAFSGRIASVTYETGALCPDAPRLKLEELKKQALQYE